MNLDTASSRIACAHLTACHALCIVRQGSRHPWRKSRPLQAGAKRAPGWDGHPWPTSFKCVGFVRHAQRPASRLSASAIAQAGSGFTPGNRKAKNRLTVAWRIAPHPPQGGFRRPSNITRDYAQFYLCTALVPRLRNAKTVRCAA